MVRRWWGRWASAAVLAAGLVLIFAGSGTGWIVALGALAAACGAGWAIADGLRAARHRDAYATFAADHGWDYLASSHDYGARFSTYPFADGIRRRQESVVRGDFSGVRCASFAHVYEEHANRDGELRVPVAHQVTLAELPVALPRLDIVPETVGAQLAKALGGRDVDVESHEFNARWRVIADDARYAHAVLDPRMIERLLAPDAWDCLIRIEGGAVYTWTPGRQGVEGLAARLGLVAGIARRIPPHVLREYRERGHGVTEGISDHAPPWATEPGALTSRRPTDLAAQAGYTPMPVEAGGGPGRSAGATGGWVAEGADALAVRDGQPPLAGPAWATESGALTSGRYTGVGVDADGDGVEDWQQLPRG